MEHAVTSLLILETTSFKWIIRTNSYFHSFLKRPYNYPWLLVINFKTVTNMYIF